ncbi:DUF6124 family protein [Pseudomonas marvdashtae]|uniref:DUF6124 family protein n=1 Tax=Pseudomonas marvdashtae TaxID=2745500 RepID=UPI003F59DA97
MSGFRAAPRWSASPAQREQAPSPQRSHSSSDGGNIPEGTAMVSDLAFDLEGSRRHIAQGVQQMIELSQLLANRALDVVDPR